MYCRVKSFDEQKLPKVSTGRYSTVYDNKPQWQLVFHATKMEGLYSISCHGVPPSTSVTAGARFNAGIQEVYASPVHDREGGSYHYGRFSPALGDGSHVECQLELAVDRKHRIPYQHKNQLCQKADMDCEGYDEMHSHEGPSILV